MWEAAEEAETGEDVMAQWVILGFTLLLDAVYWWLMLIQRQERSDLEKVRREVEAQLKDLMRQQPLGAGVGWHTTAGGQTYEVAPQESRVEALECIVDQLTFKCATYEDAIARYRAGPNATIASRAGGSWSYPSRYSGKPVPVMELDLTPRKRKRPRRRQA